MGLENSFDFVTNTLHLDSLKAPEDLTYSAMATGAGYHGVPVRDMTAAFQIFGNGGVYNEPYMYYYVEDNNGNVVLDNRNKQGEQAIKSTTATIMRHLLQNVTTGAEGTGGMA
ncbi:protein containing Penicillin-binding protein, transpeptidase domain protein, partial [human gut metagenome]